VWHLNSCWNDVRCALDFLWCPRHKDTPRQFECTRLITADHVKAVIKTIPGFGVHSRANDAIGGKQELGGKSS